MEREKRKALLSTILKYVLLSGICGMAGFSFSYHIPQLKNWLLNEVATFTRDHGPVYIFANQLNFHLVPIGISLEDVRIVPKMPLRKDLDAIHVGRMQAGIDPAMLFASQLGISAITLDNVSFTYRLHTTATKAESDPIDIPLQDIFNTPARSLHVTRLHAKVVHVDEHWTTSTDDLDLLIENRRSGLLATLQPTHFRIQTAQGNQKFDEVATLALRAQVSEDNVNLISLRFDKDDSSLNISGAAEGNINHLQIAESKWNADVQIEANPLQRSLFPLIASLKIPQIDGRVESKVEIETQQGKPFSIKGQLRTRDLKVDGFLLGSITTEIRAENQKLEAHDIHVQTKAADVHLQDVVAQLGDAPTIAGRLKFNGMNLPLFLDQLKIHKLPLTLTLGANVPCSGSLKPVEIKCAGEVTGTDFRVFNEKNKTTVALAKFNVKAEVMINSEGVFPNGTLNVGERTTGHVEGSVKIKEGFKFKYHTENLFFKDVKSLADLKFEGSAAVDGTTEGDADHGLIDLKLTTRDLWFEDFGVGNAQSDLHYKAGLLSLQNMDGVFKTSRFRGNLVIDMDKDTLEGNAQIPYIEVSDMAYMFSRKVQLPFKTFGSGVADLKVKGPLDFPRLSYTMHSNFTNLTVDAEKIAEATYNVSSVNGHVKTDHVEIKKKHGSASMTGTAEPNGQSDIQISGRGFQLEDSQIITKLGLNLQGALNFDMSMKGHILAPDTKMTGTISKSLVGQMPVGDSNFEADFHKDSIATRGALMAGKVAFDLQMPFNNAAPFKLKLDTQNWNFTPLLSFINSDSPTRDFSAELSAHIDLKANSGGFWKSTGTALVSDLKIQKGKLEVQSTAPLNAKFQDGVISFPPWKFSGDNTLFEIEAKQAQREHLNFGLTGKIELAIFSFLTPFFSDLRGTLSVAMQTLGRSDDINLVGTALIENGYVRLKAFPHPFEEIRTDAIFNKNQLIINSISMNLAGGHTYGEGSVRFEGLHNIPIQLHGRIENAQFDVPKGVHTQGSGDFQISGDWFPYLLSGNFDVQDGLYSKQFDSGDAEASVLPRANLLPRFVTEQDIDALRFNVEANMRRGLVVRNSLMDAKISGTLVIKGTTNKPALGGEIAVDPGGKLFFHETPFEISSGTVKFNDTNSDINPSITMTAGAHVQLYDVNLLAQGKASDLKINLQSTPPLSQHEIISLLALGATPDDLAHQKEYNSSQTDNLNYQAASAILSNNPFGKELKKRTGFEVKFSSAVDEVDKAAVPVIVVKRELTPKLNMSASHSLGQLVNENVKLEYKLNDRLSAIGLWEVKTYTEENGTPSSNTSPNYFGLDLQYRLQFK